MLGVPSPVHGNLRDRAIDLAEIVGRQREGRGSDVLLEPVQLRGARDRNDPRLLREQPRQRELRGGRLLPSCYPGHPIHQRPIRLAILGREAREAVAEVGAVERRVLVELPREEASSERTERDEADSELLIVVAMAIAARAWLASRYGQAGAGRRGLGFPVPRLETPHAWEDTR